jgi:hypothetical protein
MKRFDLSWKLKIKFTFLFNRFNLFALFSHLKRLSKTLKRNKFQLKSSAKRAKTVIKIYFSTFSQSLEDIKARFMTFKRL